MFFVLLNFHAKLLPPAAVTQQIVGVSHVVARKMVRACLRVYVLWACNIFTFSISFTYCYNFAFNYYEKQKMLLTTTKF